MYVPDESPMKGVTSSVTATMRSPKVVLMIFRCRMVFLDALWLCGCRIRLFRTRLVPIKAKSSRYAGPVGGVGLIEVLDL
jgi:hypothetical protein